MPSTLSTLYRTSSDIFRQAGLPTPELDARWLTAHAAGISTDALIPEGARLVPDGTAARLEGFIARRLAGEPVDRILGSRDFWTLRLKLAPATLSPRPDTETLVEACLESLPVKQAPYRIADLGTGTGAILLALLAERPNATGLGIDCAAGAVATARENAIANGVADRAAFVENNWLEGLAEAFDLIVSNPPYIPSPDLAGLDREVREHDPVLALDGGADGLDAYRAILRQAPGLLKPGGTIAFELGIGQEEAVTALMRSAGLDVPHPARRDLGGVPRALLGALLGYGGKARA